MHNLTKGNFLNYIHIQDVFLTIHYYLKRDLKLYQLKNQNQDLGMISGEVLKCALPEDCSDKALLDYPGFDIIWAKHCENLDWYPKFE